MNTQIPFVSLILPEKNEQSYICQCLDSLLKQDYPPEAIEILVIDGNSSDLTRDIVLKYAESYPIIKLLDNPRAIVPVSMNIGIREARGEVIVRIDAHAEYAVDYVSKCVEYLYETGAANVGGPMIAKGVGAVGVAVELAHHSVFGLGGGKFHSGGFEGEVDTVFLGAFRKSVFAEVGLYDERLVRNQDIELNTRIRKAGGSIFLTPRIRSTYYNRSSLAGLWKQNYKNGYWNVITKAVNPAALSLRHFIPFAFVLTLLVAAIGSFHWVGRTVFLLAAGSYLAANLAFSAAVAARSGLRRALLMPVVFAALHFSYGFGSLASIGKGNLFRYGQEDVPAALRRHNRWAKRLFDIAGSLVGIMLLWWVIALAFVIASIDTGRSGFFAQKRIGRSGKPFTIVKIRTMKPLASYDTSVTTSADPRITKVGRWLRRLKIDELPQLFNVLAGQMSFVGPRPDIPGYADGLEGDDRLILAIRPGITGPSTLKYRDEEQLLAAHPDPEAYNRAVIFPDKVLINKEYIRRYSLSLDLGYIIDTLLPNRRQQAGVAAGLETQVEES